MSMNSMLEIGSLVGNSKESLAYPLAEIFVNHAVSRCCQLMLSLKHVRLFLVAFEHDLMLTIDSCLIIQCVLIKVNIYAEHFE